MKIKTKKIIIYTFCLGLILCTVILSVAAAVSSYSYDINNNADVLEGFGAAFYLMLGAFFVLYETDLFCTVHYFIFKPKTKLKTALNILSNLSLLRQYNQGTILPIAENLSVYIVSSFEIRRYSCIPRLHNQKNFLAMGQRFCKKTVLFSGAAPDRGILSYCERRATMPITAPFLQKSIVP